MGCDIHCYVDKKDEKGNWVTADTWRPDEYDEGSMYRCDPVYSGRNYDLFAILADVRNGSGFAGCKTGGGFTPISPPKGIPDDASDEYANETDRYGSDGHSHSYFTVAELLEYDWTQVAHKQGWVTAAEYYTWKNKLGRSGPGPDAYCGAVYGGDIEHLTTEELDKRIAAKLTTPRLWDNLAAIKADPSLSRVYCLAKWDESYCSAAGNCFWGTTIPRLLALCKGDFDSVRICFFFDN